ncbi:hypothetical protein ACGFYB_32750 [Streptomyces massasporeus]|uniref:hypothetical protein n=1 Tax=Streptomyces massasporeus TaxID=67324 RepID=UPI00371B361A
MLIWDNVHLHLTARMKEFIDANAEWLTVLQLPAPAPDLKSTVGIWALVMRDQRNLAAADLGEITRAVKRRLKAIQCRSDLADAASLHLPQPGRLTEPVGTVPGHASQSA